MVSLFLAESYENLHTRNLDFFFTFWVDFMQLTDRLSSICSFFQSLEGNYLGLEKLFVKSVRRIACLDKSVDSSESHRMFSVAYNL